VTLRGETFTATTAVGVVLIVGGSWLAARAPARVPVEVEAAAAPVESVAA
jgi:drug/metabolite transporter (DMT)-like permease